jgi:uncharacterized protein YjiS (DUF1127 family)
MNNTLASTSDLAVWIATRGERAKAPGHRYTLGSLLGIITTWEERKRFRWGLEEMAKAAPHLIEDIGLTKGEVEAEIAKRFWQA